MPPSHAAQPDDERPTPTDSAADKVTKFWPVFVSLLALVWGAAQLLPRLSRLEEDVKDDRARTATVERDMGEVKGDIKAIRATVERMDRKTP